ncbi:hypothetical protein KSF73_13200 [Burkholderiaceae bacterium DAT-1]|nr:hypothetical protein [Burkholderiaceae bacterium DAT-1]
MNLSSYLNGTKLKDFFELNLKSDEVTDLLERFDMDVVYHFDRLREGTADYYSSATHTEGFELRFDERQVLETIWCYIRERSGFSKIESGSIGCFVPDTFEEIKALAISSGQRFSESANGAWLRLEDDEIWTHYEFNDGGLSLITLMRPWH